MDEIKILIDCTFGQNYGKNPIKTSRAVYRILCLPNHKVYVGSTNNAIVRFRTHKARLSNGEFHSVAMQSDFNFYGKENFSFGIIEDDILIGVDNIYAREAYYIRLYDSTNPDCGYNLAHVNESGSCKFSEDTKKKMSKSAEGRINSSETRAKIKLANTGRTPAKHSIEAAVISRSKRHTFVSPDGEVVEIFNISKFCREHNLQQSCMSEVSNGNRNFHKGWRNYNGR
jgi:group I intron endonuclease